MHIVVCRRIHPPFPSYPLPPTHQKERHARGAWKGVHSLQRGNKPCFSLLSCPCRIRQLWGRERGQRLCRTEERIKRHWWPLHMETHILTNEGTDGFFSFTKENAPEYYITCTTADLAGNHRNRGTLNT